MGLSLFGKVVCIEGEPEIGHGASKPLSNSRSVWLLGERARQVYVVLFRGSDTEEHRPCVRKNVCLMAFAIISTFGLEEQVN